MKKIIYLVAIVVLSTLTAATFSEKGKKPKPKFQRIVAFKFKADASDNARKKHMKEFEVFAKGLKQVLSYRAGKTVKGESADVGEYDVMHYITFEKETDIIVYDEHPSHKKFIEENKESWEKVLAINGAIE
ncbi:MAG TPA: Dabb family protein [Chryseolinea sp.]|nr:Dabb family protein [Chryseolinea sp.]